VSAGELSCEEIESLLPLVADGALDADSDPALFAHLARCVTCQESLACHDLVALSLTRTPMRAPSRLLRRTIPLPWAIGSAAALMVVGVGSFQYLHAVAAEDRISAGLSALHQQPTLKAEESDVISLGDIDPQHPSYILEPERHGAAASTPLPDRVGTDASLLHAVGNNNRY